MKIIIEIPKEIASDVADAFDKNYQGRITQDFKSAKPKEIVIAKEDWVKIKIGDYIKGVLKTYNAEQAVNEARAKVDEQVEASKIKVDIE